MCKNVSYDEITDGNHFEDLVVAYFRDIWEDENNSIIGVESNRSGVGPDGGVDIIITFLIKDDIRFFKRKWIVQCKFVDKNISPSAINNINIPTLIHSYKASGYLLICKHNPTSSLTNLFARLNEKCIHNYQYECWNGTHFIQKLKVRENLIPLFFPKHHNLKTKITE